MKKLAAVIIWVIALALLLHATRGVVWGYEVSPMASSSCRNTTGVHTVYVPPSSSSGWTLLQGDSFSSIASVSCGPVSTKMQFDTTAWRGSIHCQGYSLKLRSPTTNGACVEWLIGTPVPPTLGAISVDTDDIEDRISEVFILSTWLGVFLLFFFVFFGVLFYFRHR